ncbi:hypothetical protein ABZS71_07605 [Streptomyces sp. NPDC005393]|uniref:hypothetical protein n=1 Tax=Streptomyces sp. NPDC005393 TaxID=3157041 RepID=UPI0033A82E4B
MTTGSSDALDRFERVYSAASRMLWAQGAPAWRVHPQWPQERKAALTELEDVLLSVGRSVPRPGEPSDPARHLISRRAAAGDEDKPLTFGQAAEEWDQRWKADPGHLVERWEPFHEFYMEPGSCVLVTSGWRLLMSGLMREMNTRLSPGRWAMTMGQDGAELSQVAHRAADALRAPLGIQTPTSQPGRAPWIATTARWTAELPDLEGQLEHLGHVAWRASESIPLPEEIKAKRDFSVDMSTAKAAIVLREVLIGSDTPAWREQGEGIDPTAHSTLGPGTQGPRPLAQVAASWQDIFAKDREPWTPITYQLPPESELGDTHTVLSSAVALILAEILDEFSARLHPDQHSELLHFDAFELGQFCVKKFESAL